MNLKDIYIRTRQLLTHPEKEWPLIQEEYSTGKELFRTYFIPLSVLVSIVVLLSNLIWRTPLQAILLAVICLLSTTAGVWLAYLLGREYLRNKAEEASLAVHKLIIYSASVYILFQSIGTALSNDFLSQLFILISLLFIRTLYRGIGSLMNLQTSIKTNLLVIAVISVACIPILIRHVLMIIFRISALNV